MSAPAAPPEPSKVRDLLVAIATVATTTAGVMAFVAHEARAQADAGVAVHEARLSTLEQQRLADKKEADARFERLEKNLQQTTDATARTDTKVDKLLERLNVPNPAPAPAPDGGPR